MNHQETWDSMLIQAWIADTDRLWVLWGRFEAQTRESPLEIGLERVGNELFAKKPVRALFAQQWPKLSNWMWRATPKTLHSDEFYFRAVALLKKRKWNDSRRSVANEEAKREIAKDTKKIAAADQNYEMKRSYGNAKHDWKYVK